MMLYKKKKNNKKKKKPGNAPNMTSPSGKSAKKEKTLGKKQPRSESNTAVKNKKKPVKKKPRLERIPIERLKLGAEIVGKVVDLKEYGAFVQTDYAIKRTGWALLHKSQVQDRKVEDISKVLKIGQKIKSRVIKIDYETQNVSLSLRKPRTSRKAITEISVGDEMEGKVKSIASYGAFIDIGFKNDALLHISRISFDKITNVADHLNVGDKVTVHIINVDEKKRTIAASMLPKVADEYLDRRNNNRVMKSAQ